MSDTLTVGKRLVPVEHVALIEPFDPNASNRMQTDKAFQSRIVMIDRESVLSEASVASMAEALGFRMLSEDGIATNPAVRFSVETFGPTEGGGFNPSKPFASRILWHDFSGNTQSKLLLTAPEKVLAIAVRGGTEAADSAEPGKSGEATTARPARRRRRISSPAHAPG